MSRSSLLHQSIFLRVLLLMSSSSLITSHPVALATAVAVSGTIILLALCRQKPFSLHAAATQNRNPSPSPWPRPCMSPSGERKRERANARRQQKKKSVHFSDQVVEFKGNSGCEADDKDEEYTIRSRETEEQHTAATVEEEEERQRMPANRMALYNGILRDRVMHRMACCF